MESCLFVWGFLGPATVAGHDTLLAGWGLRPGAVEVLCRNRVAAGGRSGLEAMSEA